MARPAKSQWEFGELFPAKEFRKVLTVTQLTGQIRRLLEGQVGQVWVTGEITNLKLQSSGHMYFTLKDAATQVSCVLFRGEPQVNRSLLQDGRKMTLGGDVTVYESRGQYQLRVTAVELEGQGALQVAFENLKQKLQAEGLFSPDRKRSLPRYAQRIGLVTSPTGAAIRDVVHVIQRRNPALELALAPCRVQGEGAAVEIAAAIRLLNVLNRRMSSNPDAAVRGTCAAPGAFLDLILITRGGGSLEDLWAFNEEVVARAIAESELPVVSAVGHEIDFTISDFVADLRAATPSAAAEIITEGVFASCQFLSESGPRLRHLAWRRLAEKRGDFDHTVQRFVRQHPRRRLNEFVQRLDDLQAFSGRCARQALRQQQVRAKTLGERLARVKPALLLKQRRDAVGRTANRLLELARSSLRQRQDELASLRNRLRLLGPEQVLARGYSITTDIEGKVVRDSRMLRSGETIRTRLQRGRVSSTVSKISAEEAPGSSSESPIGLG